MPAAAVIPAPIAYIKVAAVKKLVVGSRGQACGPPRGGSYCLLPVLMSWLLKNTSDPWCSSLSVLGGQCVYFEKIRVFKAGKVACIMLHGMME